MQNLKEPEKFKPNVHDSLHGGPNIILQRPEIAKRLGAICAEWGRIERLYSDIFNLITFSKFIPICAHSKEELSNVIFDFFKSFHNKSQVIKKIILEKFCKEENQAANLLFEEFKKISKNIECYAKLRNELVHAEWQIHNSYPEDLFVSGSPSWFRYSEQYFEDVLIISTEIADNFSDFYVRFSAFVNTNRAE